LYGSSLTSVEGKPAAVQNLMIFKQFTWLLKYKFIFMILKFCAKFLTLFSKIFFIHIIDLKGHCLEKSVSGKILGDAVSLKFEPAKLFKKFSVISQKVTNFEKVMFPTLL
jgi:hypothetical protein